MSDYGRTTRRLDKFFFLILLPSRAFHLPRVHHAHHARRVTLYHKTNRFWCLLTCKTTQSRLLPGLDPLLFSRLRSLCARETPRQTRPARLCGPEQRGARDRRAHDGYHPCTYRIPILSIPCPSTLFILVSILSSVRVSFPISQFIEPGNVSHLFLFLFPFPTHPSPRFFLSSLLLGLGYWCRPSKTPHARTHLVCLFVSSSSYLPFISFIC